MLSFHASEPMRRVVCVLVLLGATAHGREALAQSADAAAALSLFEEGKRLADAGNHAEGCPKLEASYNAVQKLGTLINLADCYEKWGRTASAWVRFTEAAAMAERVGRQDRLTYAREHAAALLPKLSRLSLTIAGDAPAALVVKRDGTIVEPGGFGVAVPVDPGVHKLEANAPGKKAWSETVEIAANGAERSIQVRLVDDASTPAPIAMPPAETAPPTSAPSAATAASTATPPSSRAQRTVGIVLAAAGSATVAASLVFGALADAKSSKANESACRNDICTQEGLDDRRAASSLAGIATGLFIAGSVVVAGGLAVYFTAPRANAPARAALSIGPGSAALGGTW